MSALCFLKTLFYKDFIFHIKYATIAMTHGKELHLQPYWTEKQQLHEYLIDWKKEKKQEKPKSSSKCDIDK